MLEGFRSGFKNVDVVEGNAVEVPVTKIAKVQAIAEATGRNGHDLPVLLEQPCSQRHEKSVDVRLAVNDLLHQLRVFESLRSLK